MLGTRGPAPDPDRPLEVDAKTSRRGDRVLVSRIVQTVRVHGNRFARR
jgi:hypothetical protein